MTLFQITEPILREAESAAVAGASLESVLKLLRRLSLTDFGLLLISIPNSSYPALSRVLPSMAPEGVQRQWTGKAGNELFVQTASFARILETAFVRHTGRALQDRVVLDFGCGYGRNMRSMLYFTDPSNLWGVDAWDSSLELSRRDRVPGNFALSRALPQDLPVNGALFDLAFAFSVLTHLGRKSAEATLSAIRMSMRPDGLFVPTIRPVEYWDLPDPRLDDATREQMKREHEEQGFAFLPHSWSTDGSYGDTSMTIDFFRRDGWEVLGYDRDATDSYQIAVILRAI